MSAERIMAPEGVRPLRADARRNRARVLEVAEQIFAEHGLAVPIDEIARLAGVGIGTVYRHFPTKEALFEAIVTERFERILDQARASASAPDPVAALFEFLSSTVQSSRANKGLRDALIGAGIDVSAPIARLRPELMAASEVLLRRAQQAGGVRTDIAAAELGALMAGLHQTHDRDVRTELMLSVIIDGLRTPVS